MPPKGGVRKRYSVKKRADGEYTIGDQHLAMKMLVLGGRKTRAKASARRKENIKRKGKEGGDGV